MNLFDWLIKESTNITIQFFNYTSYYRLRERLPFFTLLLYRADKARHRKIYDRIAGLFISLAIAVSLYSSYLWVVGGGKEALTGFRWHYVAPIEYGIQIAIIYLIAIKFTGNVTYGNALAYHAASATGWVYEIPFFIYSPNPESTIIRFNANNIFLISYQLIACVIYLILLHEKGVKFQGRDLRYFVGAYIATFALAWRRFWPMLLGVIPIFARVPMMLFSIYLSLKLNEVKQI